MEIIHHLKQLGYHSFKTNFLFFFGAFGKKHQINPKSHVPTSSLQGRVK